MHIYLHIDVAMCLFAIVEILKVTLMIIEKMQKALITTSNGKRLVLQHQFYFRVTTAFPVVVLYMYYTDKPNVFPQQKLEIPYNILFMLKASIFTLFKVNIEIFV